MAKHALVKFFRMYGCVYKMMYNKGNVMWYAVWVRTGQEEKIMSLCNSKIMDKEVFESCFLPKYERARKVEGKWTKRKEILFPGYLFFVTENPDRLFQELKRVPDFTKILGDGDGPIPLYPEEESFLRKYTNDDLVFEMSIGDLVNGALVVVEGPLKDYQGKIVHIDRHKREATLEINFFGRKVNMKVGLEVVRKI